MSKRFVLCVAGEESGDRLGAPVVGALLDQGMPVWGCGGAQMQAAGLQCLVPFDDLAVCGVGDVLKRLPRLRRHLRVLQRALESPHCVGLVCVDYPGFNLRLKAKAEALGVPVWYVAPPQIWAWKPKRGRLFDQRDVAVLFPLEQKVYEACGARVQRVLPEAWNAWPSSDSPREYAQAFLMFPGSRLPQLKRNLPCYLQLAQQLQALTGARVVFVASRLSLKQELQKSLGSDFEVVCASHGSDYVGARGAFCPPGTVTLELALAGVPTRVVSGVDPWTYLLGRFAVRLPYWSLPNILLQRKVVEETIFALLPGLSPSAKQMQAWAQQLVVASADSGELVAQELRALLASESLACAAQKVFNTWPGFDQAINPR